MLYVLRHYHTFLDLDATFPQTLRNLAFLPRRDMFLTTDRFYDPDSQLLQKLFIGNSELLSSLYICVSKIKAHPHRGRIRSSRIEELNLA